MEKEPKGMFRFGLLGKDISYSFSQHYFSEKFEALQLNDYTYENFDIATIDYFPEVIANTAELAGMNVTIPYKQAVLPYLDEIDEEADKIGAVNTIKILDNGLLRGYNTDVFGFEESLLPLLKRQHKKALILGTGGASKAVKYVLDMNEIEVLFVSRSPKEDNEISYENISESIMKEHLIVVNCTPLGTHPAVELAPNIPYQFLSSNHLLYDLIYNPARTTFLKKGLEKGTQIMNGLKMLELQAEKSWEIWNR